MLYGTTNAVSTLRRRLCFDGSIKIIRILKENYLTQEYLKDIFKGDKKTPTHDTATLQK